MPGPRVGNNSNVGVHRNTEVKGLKPSHGVTGGRGPAPIKNDVAMPGGPVPQKTSTVPTGALPRKDVK